MTNLRFLDCWEEKTHLLHQNYARLVWIFGVFLEKEKNFFIQIISILTYMSERPYQDS